MQSIIHIALVVKDYDEAIEFYTNQRAEGAGLRYCCCLPGLIREPLGSGTV